MVNYPNKKKNNHYTSMIEGKHNTAHRGMNLEEDINLTNEYYLSRWLIWCKEMFVKGKDNVFVSFASKSIYFPL